MPSNLDKFREDLDKLINTADLLYYNMAYHLNLLDKTSKEKVEKEILTNFKSSYEQWYTESLHVVMQIIPSRLDDFKNIYRNDKRKNINYETYTMFDYLLGLRSKIGFDLVVDVKAALPKFEIQRGILASAK